MREEWTDTREAWLDLGASLRLTLWCEITLIFLRCLPDKFASAAFLDGMVALGRALEREDQRLLERRRQREVRHKTSEA